VVALYDIIYLAVWLARPERPRFGDFFALWSFGAFALTRPVTGLFDPLTLQRFQQTLEPTFAAAYPFLYPPSFLLIATPFAVLPIAPAWLAWSAISLGLYVAAVVGRRWRSAAGVALLVAPTSLLCVIGGQSGLLVAALMLGGLRSLPLRPWLGGALLGLLTVKPQFGLLLPVALVAAGQWRAIAAAALSAIAVAVATGLAFGWEVWAAWLDALPVNLDLVLRNRAVVARIAPTVGAGLFQLGVPDGIARAIQAAMALAAAVATWRAFRTGVTPAAIAVLAMAVFLATPYGYIYDLPIVTGALLLLAETSRPHRRILLLFALIALVPFAMLRTPLPLLVPALLAAAIFVVLEERKRVLF